MRKKKKTKLPIKNVVYAIITTAILLIIVQWAMANHRSLAQAESMLDSISLRQSNATERLTSLELRNDLLDTEIGVQDFLIEKYAAKRAGERVLVLVQDTRREPEVDIIHEETFWQKVGRIFFQ